MRLKSIRVTLPSDGLISLLQSGIHGGFNGKNAKVLPERKTESYRIEA